VSGDVKCLVTGAAGFVGSVLVRRLSLQGWSVLGVDRDAVSDSRRSPDVAYTELDLCDAGGTLDLVKQVQPEVIFHLAAQAFVPESIENPYATVMDNVAATASVLEAARLCGVPRVVHASSGAVYGSEGGTHVYAETSPMKVGANLYGPSKIAAEYVVAAYVATFGMDVRIGRFMNTYGPGDLNETRIIPRAVRLALQDLEYDFGTRDDGSTSLDFVYVDDVADGYIASATATDVTPGAVYNFGANSTASVRTIADTISRLVDGRDRVAQFRGPAATNPRTKSLDFAQTTATIGWRPQTDLLEGLTATVEWHRRYLGTSS
jgi:nucleoside-diphosphate-sugar epimerase